MEPATSDLLSVLLDSDQIPCKENLLTGVKRSDELDSIINDESVYTETETPLATLLGPPKKITLIYFRLP